MTKTKLIACLIAGSLLTACEVGAPTAWQTLTSDESGGTVTLVNIQSRDSTLADWAEFQDDGVDKAGEICKDFGYQTAKPFDLLQTRCTYGNATACVRREVTQEFRCIK